MRPLCRGTAEQKAMAQDALDRWWWPSLMMFGPSDKESQHSDTSLRWKIKRFSNDELRQKFVDATGPCNRQRMKQRREADERGGWVREAALAYAEKRAKEKAA